MAGAVCVKTVGWIGLIITAVSALAKGSLKEGSETEVVFVLLDQVRSRQHRGVSNLHLSLVALRQRPSNNDGRRCCQQQ